MSSLDMYNTTLEEVNEVESRKTLLKKNLANLNNIYGKNISIGFSENGSHFSMFKQHINILEPSVKYSTEKELLFVLFHEFGHSLQDKLLTRTKARLAFFMTIMQAFYLSCLPILAYSYATESPRLNLYGAVLIFVGFIVREVIERLAKIDQHYFEYDADIFATKQLNTVFCTDPSSDSSCTHPSGADRIKAMTSLVNPLKIILLEPLPVGVLNYILKFHSIFNKDMKHWIIKE